MRDAAAVADDDDDDADVADRVLSP